MRRQFHSASVSRNVSSVEMYPFSLFRKCILKRSHYDGTWAEIADETLPVDMIKLHTKPAHADRRRPTATADRRMPTAMAEAHHFDGPRKSQEMEIAVPAVLVRKSHSGTQGGVLHSQAPEHGGMGTLRGTLGTLGG